MGLDYLDWRLESAAHSDGWWLVAVEAKAIRAFVPPGLRATRTECQRVQREGPLGWRLATWPRRGDDHWPLIEDDAPAALHEVETRLVVETVAADLHDQIWVLMVRQLADARQVGRAAAGQLLDEDLVRAGAMCASWLERELDSAFPVRRRSGLRTELQVHRPQWVPDTYDEFVQAMPPTQLDAALQPLPERRVVVTALLERIAAALDRHEWAARALALVVCRGPSRTSGRCQRSAEPATPAPADTEEFAALL